MDWNLFDADDCLGFVMRPDGDVLGHNVMGNFALLDDDGPRGSRSFFLRRQIAVAVLVMAVPPDTGHDSQSAGDP